MRTIDMQTWPRREHFNVFSNLDHPHFGMCANVDLRDFYNILKQRSISLNVAIVYVLSRAANAIPEFRQRIRGDQVVEHEVVHPSTTILTDEDLFSFCTIKYSDNFRVFAPRAADKIAQMKRDPTLKDEPGHDDLLYMTAIPWVSFTSFLHPLNLHPPDSVPRLAWGKIFEDGNSLKMPLDVQGHHALMDGVHVGWFYEHVQELLSDPGIFLHEA